MVWFVKHILRPGLIVEARGRIALRIWGVECSFMLTPIQRNELRLAMDAQERRALEDTE